MPTINRQTAAQQPTPIHNEFKIDHVQLKARSEPHATNTNAYSYDTAFSRNIGIISKSEQALLRTRRVALAGLGGMGGVYAEALARMGVGYFSLADGDDFEVANFNRQVGGTINSVGQNKARIMEQRIHAINPDAQVTVWEKNLDAENISDFLENADIVVDAIEAFSVPAHRLLHRNARAQKLSIIFGAPLCFSAAVLIFGPHSMSTDEYFDWHDIQPDLEQVVNLFMGVAPAGLHYKNYDFSSIDLEQGIGPSNIAGCLLCAGVVATEVARLLLNRPGTRLVPAYLQMDAYSHKISCGRLSGGNRNWKQRIRRWVLWRRYQRSQKKKTSQG